MLFQSYFRACKVHHLWKKSQALGMRLIPFSGITVITGYGFPVFEKGIGRKRGKNSSNMVILFFSLSQTTGTPSSTWEAIIIK